MQELKYDGIKGFFWTDSRMVLGYITNDVRRFHVFVANSVQQIKEKTLPTQWNYIATKDNPADQASRSLTAQAVIESTTWWNGPPFLWTSLPTVQSNEEVSNISLDDPVVKKICTTSTEIQEKFSQNGTEEKEH